DIAILAQESDLTVESTVVRDTLPQAADLMFGRGINVQTDEFAPSAASLVLRFSTVLANRDVGVILLGGATGRVENSLIATTGLREADATLGDGLDAQSHGTAIPQLEVIDSVVADNVRAGIGNFGSFVALQSSVFRCNAVQLNGEDQNAGPFNFDDRGGNLCGCDEPLGTCQVLSAGLHPPDPVSSQ
ncbi:MAG: hypothetical protein JRI68_28885, partial [Deltaproteobacteria bacterium]|nr:hypothetical protein [Deltaproteobacteria bacterium]